MRINQLCAGCGGLDECYCVPESRVPELNPWRDAGVLASHSHVADAPCDETCSVYDRRSASTARVCRECAAPWPLDGTEPSSRCASCDCPFWVQP